MSIEAARARSSGESLAHPARCAPGRFSPRQHERSSRARRAGYTLVEVLVALAISSILLTSLASLVFFSTRSFVALLNYVDLDDNSRRALDVMSRDIRESERLINYSPTQLTFDYTNGTTLKFTYNPDTRTLVRTLNNQSETLLTECDFLQFSIFQRNPVGGTYDQYPTATPATCKLVQLNWVCSRNILGLKANTESVESAKIVIRRE